MKMTSYSQYRNWRTFSTFFVFLGVLRIDNVVLGEYRSYQTTIYCNPATEIQTPADLPALQQIIQDAISQGQTVKAVGGLGSLTDLICTDGIPISMENFDYAQINSDGTVTFGAGKTLYSALEFLETNGLSLIAVPTFGGLTMGGVIATGSYLSSLNHPSMSDQVVRMNVIIGNGTLVEISGPELNLFRVHLGLLGIIVDVTFQTVPLFKMTKEHTLSEDTIIFDGSAVAEAANYDIYDLWWFPQSSHVVVGKGVYVSVDTPGQAYTNFIPDTNVVLISAGSATFELLQETRNTEALEGLADQAEQSLYTEVTGKPPIFTENGETVLNPATGYAWRLQTNMCSSGGLVRCGWENGEESVYQEESAISFDLAEFTGVIKMMREVIDLHPAAFPLVGIYIRFTKESPATMAISYGRASFTVELVTPMRKDPFNTSRDAVGTYQALLQEMVTNYGGRPAWSKNGLHYFSSDVISTTTPNRLQFISAMNTYDPEGLFLNAFGRRMLGISDAQDRDPSVTHCALQDYCVCSTAEDCAPLQHCAEINGFPVCMDDELA